jgi:hypothetical protein
MLLAAPLLWRPAAIGFLDPDVINIPFSPWVTTDVSVPSDVCIHAVIMVLLLFFAFKMWCGILLLTLAANLLPP